MMPYRASEDPVAEVRDSGMPNPKDRKAILTLRKR